MAMNREQREQARRMSEFVDGLLLHRRYDERDAEPATAEEREFRELCGLAQFLSDVVIVPPQDFGEILARRLPTMSDRAEGAGRMADAWNDVLRLLARARTRFGGVLTRFWTVSAALPSATFVVLIAAAFIFVRSLVDVPVASASEILSRSDAALGKLVRPGQLLYRRWKVTSMVTDADGGESRRVDRMIHEWMDGADFDRVAGRWYSGDERLEIAYTSVGQGGLRRPNVYFSPGVFGEARGVLNIEPTREEFEKAVYRFPEPEQGALNAYLDRQYIYQPVTGERRFNRAIIEAPRHGSSDMPRIVLSFDRSETLNGMPVYRVRVVDPAYIEFNWRSNGPPRVRLACAEIVRYIARDSYLSVRTEETETFEGGRRMFTSKELVETRAVSATGLLLDPFKLEVPVGTPVQQQSAFEQLSGVASAFSHLPEVTSACEHGNVRD